MPKKLLLLVSLLSFMQGIAQDDTITDNKLSFGLRTGHSSYTYIHSPNYFFWLTFSKGKHEFAIGPSWGNTPVFFYSSSFLYKNDDISFNGFDLSYRIYPNGKTNRFNLFFQLDGLKKWGQRSYPIKINDYPFPGQSIEDVRTVKGTSTQFALEQGFDLNFLRHCYVGFSYGLIWKIETINHLYNAASSNNKYDKHQGIQALLRFSLGYRF